MLTAAQSHPVRGEARSAIARAARISAGLTVDAADVAFEEGDVGTAHGWSVGRRVIFVARARGAPGRDVFRAVVRVTPRGDVIAMRGVTNVTRTPLDDDAGLVVRPPYAAFWTRAYGQVQTASVLDLRGARSVAGGWRSNVSMLADTGSWRGFERMDLRLDRPARAPELSLDAARATLADPETHRRWDVSLADGAVEHGDGIVVTRGERLAKPLVLWLVDRVRAVAWIGAAPVAWAERLAFAARDFGRRLRYRWFGRETRSAPADDALGGAPPTTRGTEIARALSGDTDWPPPSIRPRLRTAERWEGLWRPVELPWLRTIPGAPPTFYRTFIRVDSDRPYTRVVIVAADMRQLELAMRAGSEDPQPLVGPPGDGRLPRDPDVQSRVVAVFNGAFKTEHGQYGMMVDRRVLLPPQPRAATVAVLADGRVAYGSWGATRTIPDTVTSFRQNLDPLVADGIENPARRMQWGFVLGATGGGLESLQTMRSGTCMHAGGQLLYFWSEDISGRMLGRAMNAAGCAYGIHLDMNPLHTGFHFLRIDDLAHRRFQYAELAVEMDIPDDRYVYWSPKDFFYLSLRRVPSPAPARLAGATWETDTVAQPAPTWLPAIATTDVSLGGTHRGRMLAVDLRRIELRFRAGLQEPGARTPDDTTISADDARRVVGALMLGLTRPSDPAGLLIDGRVTSPFVPGHPALAFDPNGVRVVAGELIPHEIQWALQGHALTDAPPRQDAGTTLRPRAALGFVGTHLVYVWGNGDADGFATALRTAGVENGVLLERGTPLPPEQHWARTDDAVRDAYPQSVLYLLARPPARRMLRLETLFVP